MLIHLFDHVGRAMPHEFRDVLLRDIEQKQLAGVMMSERVKIQMFAYLGFVAFTETAPVVRDDFIGPVAYAFAIVGEVHYKVVCFLGYRNGTVPCCAFGFLDDLFELVVNYDCFHNVDVIGVDIAFTECCYLFGAHAAFSSKEHWKLICGAFHQLENP